MNTNNNAYTVIYTTIVVVIVAAALAFVSQKLGPMQQANAKAETLRQMMTAAGIKTDGELAALKNAEVLQLYSENIDRAFTIDLSGQETGRLGTEQPDIELIDALKGVNKAVESGSCNNLPVYIFKGNITVIPIYGAGLWGPVWGYVAFEADGCTIRGAYFDHESETPGLGGKIKEDPAFRAGFAGKKASFDSEPVFTIGKNATKDGAENAVDAITGATMTSKGLNAAVRIWFNAYNGYLKSVSEASAAPTQDVETENTDMEEE